MDQSTTTDEAAPQVGGTATRRLLLWVARAIFLLALVASFVTFLNTFSPDANRPVDYGLWLGAIIAWALLLATFGTAPFIGLRPRWRQLWPLAVLLPLFAACWLQFYDNWRWAYTGDSFGVYAVTYWLPKNGLRTSLLSVHGIDNAFTYLWEVTYSWPMYFLGSELIWHRVGQLIIACAALAAIYLYFRMVVGNLWASVIVVATAANYVWLWVTYVSYYKIDSNVFYFLMLIWGTLIWRHPERLGLWMMAGLTAGLSLFYTPSAWAGVMAVGLFVAAYGLMQRRFGAVAVAGLSFPLIAVPILLEWRHMRSVIQMQSVPVGPDRQSFFPGFEYTWKIFREIMLAPYDSVIDKLGVSGPFFQPPLGHAYLVGIGLAAIALVPWLRRRLRLPGAAPVLLALLVFDAALLAFSNKGYGNVSHKRSYNIIPLQMFFAVLPFYMLYALGSARRRWRLAVVGSTAVVLVFYGAMNARAILNPHNGMYGVNIYDGLIQLRQTDPQRPVFVFTTRDFAEALSRKALFHYVYGLMDNVTLTDEFTVEEFERGCSAGVLLCYEPNFDTERFKPLLDAFGDRVAKFEVVNSQELRCFECRPPAS
jgi:hypothetical protein